MTIEMPSCVTGWMLVKMLFLGCRTMILRRDEVSEVSIRMICGLSVWVRVLTLCSAVTWWVTLTFLIGLLLLQSCGLGLVGGGVTMLLL